MARIHELEALGNGGSSKPLKRKRARDKRRHNNTHNNAQSKRTITKERRHLRNKRTLDKRQSQRNTRNKRTITKDRVRVIKRGGATNTGEQAVTSVKEETSTNNNWHPRVFRILKFSSKIDATSE